MRPNGEPSNKVKVKSSPEVAAEEIVRVEHDQISQRGAELTRAPRAGRADADREDRERDHQRAHAGKEARQLEGEGAPPLRSLGHEESLTQEPGARSRAKFLRPALFRGEKERDGQAVEIFVGRLRDHFVDHLRVSGEFSFKNCIT